jgi:hypothetical protein
MRLLAVIGLWIASPCSGETAEEMLSGCRQVAHATVHEGKVEVPGTTGFARCWGAFGVLQEEAPSGCRQIQALTEADERHSELLEFLHEQHEMSEGAPEAIQLPHDHRVELSPAGIANQNIEARTAVLRAGDNIDVFVDGRPTASFDVAPKIEELVVDGLVEGGHSRVDRSSHLQE